MKSTRERRPLPIEAVIARVRPYFKRRECLHPDAPTSCGKSISAHTISRSALLGRIIDPSNKVLTFLGTAAAGELEPNPVALGWREASTFAGFCSAHDGPLFAPIEQRPFQATPEQCFLLAYRAVCHELYQKRSASNSRPEVHKLLIEDSPPTRGLLLQQALNAQTSGVLKGLADAIDIKSEMDEALRSANFDQWVHTIFYFSGDVSIVTAGAPTPNFDFQGNNIQTLHDIASNIQPMPIGMSVADTGFAVVFSGRRTDPAPVAFANQLRSFPPNEVPHIIAQFMLAYLENTFFSRSWWDSRRMYVRSQVRQIAREPNPYYFPPKYVVRHVVPWRLESIVTID